MNSKSPSKGQSSGVKALFEDSPECSISNVEAKTTFHYFADLPSELQIQVWEAAASIPRVVFLRPKTAVDRTNLPEKFCDKIPAVLHVNRQSRHVCQHTYHVRIQLRLAPLGGDGPLSLNYFLCKLAESPDDDHVRLSPTMEAALRRYVWHSTSYCCIRGDLDKVRRVLVYGPRCTKAWPGVLSDHEVLANLERAIAGLKAREEVDTFSSLPPLQRRNRGVTGPIVPMRSLGRSKRPRWAPLEFLNTFYRDVGIKPLPARYACRHKSCQERPRTSAPSWCGQDKDLKIAVARSPLAFPTWLLKINGHNWQPRWSDRVWQPWSERTADVVLWSLRDLPDELLNPVGEWNMKRALSADLNVHIYGWVGTSGFSEQRLLVYGKATRRFFLRGWDQQQQQRQQQSSTSRQEEEPHPLSAESRQLGISPMFHEAMLTKMGLLKPSLTRTSSWGGLVTNGRRGDGEDDEDEIEDEPIAAHLTKQTTSHKPFGSSPKESADAKSDPKRYGTRWGVCHLDRLHIRCIKSAFLISRTSRIEARTESRHLRLNSLTHHSTHRLPIHNHYPSYSPDSRLRP
ncbi:hypothetical protein VTJ04DRAFT_8692 [Mycothermus thermophilus]|uniref:uncharacterized protein n=1 Tax=Humicola insolens TaxID=85995 RepID=UPI00374315C3